MKIILFGMKHSGKSTLGRALARFLGCPFYDVDELIENAFKTELCRKMSVREILAHYGEKGFNEREERTVYDLYNRLKTEEEIQRQGGTPSSDCVIALGGRTPLNRKLAGILKDLGLNIFLKVDALEMWRRAMKNGIPSFLKSPDPMEEFLALYKKREPHYEKHADLTVCLDDLSLEESVHTIVRAIGQEAIGQEADGPGKEADGARK
ncbi:MAG TPA: shikimate kinase [Spirochaetia bacterium]|nr:shikimate kinase [Spirochaetia bacterium]